jgi:hypothetical protein
MVNNLANVHKYLSLKNNPTKHNNLLKFGIRFVGHPVHALIQMNQQIVCHLDQQVVTRWHSHAVLKPDRTAMPIPYLCIC